MKRRALALSFALSFAVAAPALADEAAEDASPQGYTPPEGSVPAFSLSGYVDVGFARATGDGTSFRAGDTRIPADYGVDTFAPAVNSRGDVASTDSGGRFVNGFLPHSAGIGGRPSFLLNTFDLDLRYVPQTAPVMAFARVQFLPRLTATGDATRVLLDQAFGRIIPLDSQELAISIGKFDSVFGIEYLDTQANIRTGITPSLMARYTTGTSIGAKVFFRKQLPKLWSAFSLNVAGTNSGPRVDSLQGPDASLTGKPVASGRFGYELNLPKFEVKLGASGLLGPRNDQRDGEALQRGYGFDARFIWGGLSLGGEYVNLEDDEGTTPEKLTGEGPFDFASGFYVHGWYATGAYAFHFDGPLRSLTFYGRYGRRHAEFEGYTPITVDRITVGARADLWDSFSAKVEGLTNRELAGAPDVPNDVLTSSFIYSW